MLELDLECHSKVARLNDDTVLSTLSNEFRKYEITKTSEMKTDLLVMKAATFGRCVRDNRFDWTSGISLEITAPLCSHFD